VVYVRYGLIADEVGTDGLARRFTGVEVLLVEIEVDILGL